MPLLLLLILILTPAVLSDAPTEGSRIMCYDTACYQTISKTYVQCHQSPTKGCNPIGYCIDGIPGTGATCPEECEGQGRHECMRNPRSGRSECYCVSSDKSSAMLSVVMVVIVCVCVLASVLLVVSTISRLRSVRMSHGGDDLEEEIVAGEVTPERDDVAPPAYNVVIAEDEGDGLEGLPSYDDATKSDTRHSERMTNV
eukprot:sb/3470753/